MNDRRPSSTYAERRQSGFVSPRTNWGAQDRREIQEQRSRTEDLAQLGSTAPRIPWDVFVTKKFQWQTSEHVAMIGPTGQGKTTMLMNVLPLHPFVTVTATKPRDTTMDTLVSMGYLKMERWQSLDANQHPRRVLWPDATRLNSEDHQREVFRDAMHRIYREGGWTFAIDELWYFVNMLGMEKEVKIYLLQARSLGISLVIGTQRPAWVPLEVYDQSTHLMFWRDNDERNLDRISGVSYLSAKLVKKMVAGLERYQILYINTRTGEMCRTRCPKVPTITGGRVKR